MVLDKGHIKEWGSHRELIQIEGGHYKELVDNSMEMKRLKN